MTSMNFIGLDIHKKTISFCVKDISGKVLSEGKIPATRQGLQEWVGTLVKPWTVAIEATMFTGWIYDYLRSDAAAVKVAHPLMLRAIAVAKKNDRIDAGRIADCLRRGDRREIELRPAESRVKVAQKYLILRQRGERQEWTWLKGAPDRHSRRSLAWENLLTARRENALQGDAEVESEIRHQVVVRLIAAHYRHHVRGHGLILCGVAGVGIRGGTACLHETCISRLAGLSPNSGPVDAVDGVSMSRHLGFEQRDGIRATGFAEIMQGEARPLARVHWSAPLEIGKRKVAFPVSPVGGSQQREERRVLGDGHELAVAKGPPCGREVEREYPYFCYKRICHVAFSFAARFGWGIFPVAQCRNSA